MEVKSTVCKSREEVATSTTPGALYLKGHLLLLRCPGCGNLSGMDVYFPGELKPPSPSWLVEDGLPAITLKPSVNCVGCCKWHGWLTDGVFTGNKE